MKYEKTELNKIKRGAKKASYDKKVINAILDASEICHIAFIFNDKPFVQPINFGRKDNKIYIHGSLNNRMTNALIESKEVCLNVMILDAMKLTRSAFHHSVNYRSVVVFGTVKELISKTEKLIGLKSIINHFVPNRWDHCRKPNDKELKATKVLEITIQSASAKIAAASPTDNKEDLTLDYWAGTIPVKTVLDQPIADEFMQEGVETPAHIMRFLRMKNR